MTDLASGFLNLFKGRADAYGVFGGPDPERPGKRVGGCVRQPLTPEHYRRHLEGDSHTDWLGVYPCIGTRCSWGCVDIDDTNDPTLANTIVTLLAHKQITGWVERTESGYHVWVFPETPLVESAIMRGALSAACEAAGYSPKEVNPKSPDVGRGPGNYVRLPLPGAMSAQPPRIRMIVDQGGSEMDVHSFVAEANARRASTQNLSAVAALWTPPATAELAIGVLPPLDKKLTDKLSPLAYTVYVNGPLAGSDRSTTMARMAHLCFESGLTPDEAYTIMAQVDQTWGKRLLDHPSGEQWLLRMLENAYS